MEEPTFDKSGYPTEETLEAIKCWSYTDFTGLVEFIKKAWSYPDRVVILSKWSDEIGVLNYENVLYLSTGGWSGNEDIIDALKKNLMFWMTCWLQSRVGGHFWFVVTSGSK